MTAMAVYHSSMFWVNWKHGEVWGETSPVLPKMARLVINRRQRVTFDLQMVVIDAWSLWKFIYRSNGNWETLLLIECNFLKQRINLDIKIIAYLIHFKE